MSAFFIPRKRDQAERRGFNKKSEMAPQRKEEYPSPDLRTQTEGCGKRKCARTGEHFQAQG